MSDRDRAILALARDMLHGSRGDFGQALAVLQKAVERFIPAGRTYFLGMHAGSPVIGSIFSGVGIAEEPTGIVIVRVHASSAITVLGRLVP